MAFMPDDGAYVALDRKPRRRRSRSSAARVRNLSNRSGGVAVRTATLFAAAAALTAIGLAHWPPSVERTAELQQREPMTEKTLYLDHGVLSAVSQVRLGR